MEELTMKKISRRDFMKCTAAAAAAMGLAACGASSSSTAASTSTASSAAASSAAGSTASVASSGDSYTFRCSTNHSQTFCTSVALDYWAKLVSDRTGGRITIENYFDAVLGDEKSAIEQCQYGGLDFARVNISPMCEFVDNFNALSMPYIYKSDDHFWKVTETMGMEMMTSKEMTDAGFYGLTWYDGGTRNFYNSKHEIHTPDDMKGLNIRVQESNLMISMVEALGANATAMPYGDVYSGLQTGVIDGAENSMVQYLEVSHCEVAKYFTLDAHTRAPDMLIMSEQVREKLSDADMKIISDAAMESWKYQRGLWADAEKEVRSKLETAGNVITDLTDDERQKFIDACSPLWKTYSDGKYLDIINQAVALA
jgi:tripartite ATP-independent transporter DctP family solute receptor